MYHKELLQLNIVAILKCLVPFIRQGSRSTSETKSKKKIKEHHKEAEELQNNVHLHRSCLESEQDWQGEQREDDIGKEKNFLKQYAVIKFLGRGSFGNVTLVKRTLEGKEELFAMMTVHKTGSSKYVQPRRKVEKDVFLQAVGHPFLMQLHSYFETKVTHYCVMDYIPGGTMWSKLKRKIFSLRRGQDSMQES